MLLNGVVVYLLSCIYLAVWLCYLVNMFRVEPVNYKHVCEFV